MNFQVDQPFSVGENLTQVSECDLVFTGVYICAWTSCLPTNTEVQSGENALQEAKLFEVDTYFVYDGGSAVGIPAVNVFTLSIITW